MKNILTRFMVLTPMTLGVTFLTLQLICQILYRELNIQTPLTFWMHTNVMASIYLLFSGIIFTILLFTLTPRNLWSSAGDSNDH